ncbi:hypothetical protein DSO57_1028607 [Entomophthora muscae]|uniref:Uncharacterized protein n=1 Tax=Entomophthora muscae TaxID=34485 RepID=A0ACC2SEC0_9FUNG|nr:hypothetical protein DSO57_1028607 [Entomophthora muscae]
MNMSDYLWKRFSDLTAGEKALVQGSVVLLDVVSYTLGLLPFYVFPYLLIQPAWGQVEVAVMTWCMLEFLFRLYVHLCVRGAEGRRPVPMKTMPAPVTMARRILSQMGDPTVLTKWLSPDEALSKSGLGFLTTRIFFEKARSELSQAELVQANQLDLIFQCDGKDLTFSKETLWPSSRPVQYKVRSAVTYCFTGTVRIAGAIRFYTMGFQWNSLPTGLGYWIHQKESSQPPILYFHGIGFGPTQMLPHVKALLELYPNRTIILFNLPQISMSPLSPVATEEEILDAIDILFQDNNLKKVSAVGHSYGTIMCMWLAMRRPTYLAKLTFIDPVCFMLWNSNLVTRAYYARPTTAVHHLVRNFVSQDHNFSLTISRYMYWICSFETCNAFPCPTNVYLGSQDWVIDAPATYAYLMQRKCSLNQTNLNIHLNEVDHIQFMFTPKLLDQINRVI